MMSGDIDNLDKLNQIPSKLKEIILKMIKTDPNERINMTQIINNEWFIEMEKLSY